MSRLMHVCGIVLAAIGLALAVVNFSSPGQMQIYGLTFESAAILLTGGLLCLGLSGVIQQLGLNQGHGHERAILPDVTQGDGAPHSMSDLRRDMPSFRPRSVETGAVAAGTAMAGAAAVAEAVKDTVAPSQISVAETIEALEQAKTDIKAALGGDDMFDDKPSAPAAPLPVNLDVDVPAPPVIAAVAVEDEKPEPEEPGLYVVEEQVVRGKPARVLSDGTVEAETDDGWMRFENLEHLNEYLDSLT